MGRIDLSNLAGLSGRIGPVIAYVTKDGKQAFRSYTKPADPKTPKQMAQRAKLVIVNKGLSPLRKIIKQGHPGKEDAYRTLIGKACREAVEGTYPELYLDYSKIEITTGRLQLPTDVHLHLDSLSHTAAFRWNTQLVYPSLPGRGNDKMHVVCFDTAHPAEVKTLLGNTRATGETVVEINAKWQPDTTHFWIYFVSHDLRDISNSVYVPRE